MCGGVSGRVCSRTTHVTVAAFEIIVKTTTIHPGTSTSHTSTSHTSTSHISASHTSASADVRASAGTGTGTSPRHAAASHTTARVAPTVRVDAVSVVVNILVRLGLVELHLFVVWSWATVVGLMRRRGATGEGATRRLEIGECFHR